MKGVKERRCFFSWYRKGLLIKIFWVSLLLPVFGERFYAQTPSSLSIPAASATASLYSEASSFCTPSSVLPSSSFLFPASCQTPPSRILYCTEEDRALFARYLAFASSNHLLADTVSVPDLIIETARFFLGTPYVASTLEKEPEGLVVNLRQMDCTTFVENVLALTRTLQYLRTSHDSLPPFEIFCNHLQQLRYRQGTISDYTDRLHYMTDWLYENARKGWVKDLNAAIGGESLPLSLSFISTHPGSYKQLADHPERIRKMEEIEKEINARRYFYLPKTRIPQALSRLQNGDIVCFVTTIAGLDVTHVGLIYRQKGTVSFIHASSVAKKVIINQESLQEYTGRMKSNRGLLLARPLPIDL